MRRLIQLKNGNWIDPKTIVRISALDAFGNPDDDFIPPRVLIHDASGQWVSLHYPSFVEACEDRDVLAAMVNETEASGS